MTSFGVAAAGNILQLIPISSLADDDEVTLLDAHEGFCLLSVGALWTIFHFTAEGVVEEVMTCLTGGFAFTDTGDGSGDICIYDKGTQVGIINRTGSPISGSAFPAYIFS